jgi:peptidoglycan/LPS O-acetylase OafA/YrhL
MLDEPMVNRTWLRVGVSIFGAWLVVALSAEAGTSKFEGKDMFSRSMLYIGKVSYGLYLFHKCVPTLLVELGLATTDWYWWLAEYSPLPMFDTGNRWYALTFRLTELGWEFLVAVLISTLSWRFFERFFNRLKKHIGYKGMRLSGGS